MSYSHICMLAIHGYVQSIITCVHSLFKDEYVCYPKICMFAIGGYVCLLFMHMSVCYSGVCLFVIHAYVCLLFRCMSVCYSRISMFAIQRYVCSLLVDMSVCYSGICSKHSKFCVWCGSFVCGVGAPSGSLMWPSRPPRLHLLTILLSRELWWRLRLPDQYMSFSCGWVEARIYSV